MARKGQAFADGVAKCKNCRGPHRSQENARPAEEVRQTARGWKPPFHHEGSGRLRPG